MSLLPSYGAVATPEQRLAAAIIAQAFTDMFLPDSADGASKAAHFLTTSYGPSAQWRNRLASYLDIDGDQLAARVRLILDGDADPPGYDTRFLKHLHIARERWAAVPRVQTPSTTSRLPRIRPPSLPAPTVAPTISLEPEVIDLAIPVDPFYISGTGHIRASRPWRDGETSRFLGTLPSIHTKIGGAMWMISQGHRSGFNALKHIATDPHAMVETLCNALPSCEVSWSIKGNRLPEYQPNAGLRDRKSVV